MYIQRLAWAGIRISTGDFNIVIDPLVNLGEATRFMGTPRTEAVPIKELSVQLALVTHLHPDHYDPATLRSCLTPRGRVLCPEEIAPRLNTDHVPHKEMQVYKPVSTGRSRSRQCQRWTVSATTRCRGSSRCRANASSTAVTRSGMATGGASPSVLAHLTWPSCRSTALSCSSLATRRAASRRC